MKPELRPISVTIVDLMGALLPGTVWLILLMTSRKLFWALFQNQPNSNDITPVSVISDLAANKTFPFYIILLLLSFIIGYSVKLLAMPIAEWLCGLFSKLWHGYKGEIKDYMFPFNEKHKNEPYLKEIIKELKSKFSYESDTKSGDSEWTLGNLPKGLPQEGTQPYSICKRILRVINPTLWEEIELREATVRMIGSILLASIFSTICCISLSFRLNPWLTSITWIVSSVISTVILAISFRKARNSEVIYTYLNFLIALKFKSVSEDSQK
jgi:hypothetical protein